MINTMLLIEFIEGVASQLPVLIVALVGVIVTLTRWKDAPSARVWSLLGFGIAIILCFLVPASQVGVRYWIMQNPMNHVTVTTAFTVLTIFWSVLRAASYVSLLVAIFAGRPGTV